MLGVLVSQVVDGQGGWGHSGWVRSGVALGNLDAGLILRISEIEGDFLGIWDKEGFAREFGDFSGKWPVVSG